MRRLFETDLDHLDEATFRTVVIEEFPQAWPHIEGFEELTHLVAGGLARYANDCLRGGQLRELERIYDSLAYLARHCAQLHPSVLNALHVSFLEPLDFDHAVFGARALALLPPVLREMWAAQMEHNRKIVSARPPPY